MTIDKRFFKYLLIGGINTVFGYGVYAVSVYLTAGKYVIAAVVSQILGVTFSYATYKFFVFQTRGNYLAEYVRCWSVYGLAAVLSVAVLPVFVWGFKQILSADFILYAPYLGGLATTGITVVFSFFGHAKVTFKAKNQ